MRQQEQANIKVNLESQQAEQRLESLNKESKALREEMTRLRKANDKAGYDKVAKQLKQVEKEAKKLKEETVDVNRVMNNLNGVDYNELLKTKRQLVKQMRQIKDRGSDAYLTVKERVKQLNTELNDVNADMRDSVPLIDRANNAFNNYSGMILAAVAAIAAFVMALREMSDLIMNFEKGFTNVKTLLSAEDLEKYSAELEKGAIETIKKYGFAVDDVNQSLFDTISAGVPAANAIKVLDEASKLAIGGVTDLSVATDGMTTVMNAWKLELNEVEQVSSAFFSAQKAGKTTVAQLSSEIGKVAPIAAQANISYQETLSMLAELTKGGISTSEATTYLKSAISSLVNPSNEAQKVLTKFGVPFGTSAIRAAGFTNVLDKLNEVIQKSPDEISKAITSVEGLTAVSVLSGEGLKDYKQILQSVNTDFGDGSSLAEAFAMQQETMEQTMKRASASVKALVLEMKESFKPTLKAIFQTVSLTSNVLKKMFGWLNKNKEEVKKYAKIISVAVVAIGAYRLAVVMLNRVQRADLLLTNALQLAKKAWVTIYALLTGRLKAATRAQKAFNLSVKANPIGLLVSILATAATAFLAYRDKVREATEAEKKFQETVKANKALLDSAKSVEELAKGMDKMNLRQLENVKMRAEKELQTYQDLNLEKELLLKKYQETVQKENAIARTHARDDKEYMAMLNNKSMRTESNEILRQLSAIGEMQSKFNKFEIDRIISTSKIKIDHLRKLEAEANKPKPKPTGENKKEVKDTRLEALENLIVQTGKLNDKLELERLSANERELEQIRRKYADELVIAREGEARKDEYSLAHKLKRIELEKMLDEELQAKKLEQVKRFQEEIKKAREKFGVIDEDEKQQTELTALWDSLQNKLLTYEEYEQAKTEINAKYAEARKKKEAEAQKEILKKHTDSLNEQMAVTDAFSNFFAAAKQGELAAAGDNEEKKKQIQKKYADIEMVTQIAKTTASTALAVMRAIADLGPIAGPIAGVVIGATGALQIGQIVAERNRIKGLESGGKFPVQRAQDNKTFWSSFAGLQRGYFAQPTVLVGEGNKPEYVVSSSALDNPVVRDFTDIVESARVNGQMHQLNYNSVISALSKPQGYESGGYTKNTAPAAAVGQRQEYATTDDLKEVLLRVDRSNEANAKMIANIKVAVNAREVQNANDKYAEIENRATA